MTWPVGWQAASVALCAALVTGLFLFLPPLERDTLNTFVPLAGDASTRAAAALTTLDALLNAVETVTTAARVVWGALVEPVAPYLLAIVVVMCLACTLFAAALKQITSGRMVAR